MRIAAPLALRPGDEAKLRKMASARSVPAGGGAAAGLRGPAEQGDRRAGRAVCAVGAALAIPVRKRRDRRAGRRTAVRTAAQRGRGRDRGNHADPAAAPAGSDALVFPPAGKGDRGVDGQRDRGLAVLRAAAVAGGYDNPAIEMKPRRFSPASVCRSVSIARFRPRRRLCGFDLSRFFLPGQQRFDLGDRRNLEGTDLTEAQRSHRIGKAPGCLGRDRPV